MEAILKVLHLPARNNRLQWLYLLLLPVYGITGFMALKDYLLWDSAGFLVGLGALPLMFGQPAGARRAHMGWLALAFALLTLLIPVKTAVYMTLCCALLFLFEHHRGRCTSLPLFTFILMSPVCSYFAHVFSFPIRLQLTALAGALLHAAGMPVTVAGNIIGGGATEFSVDPACMGLSMLVVSLLCGLILVAFYQRRYQRYLTAVWILLFLAGLVVLNCVANLCRILLLVYFHLLPDNPMHGLCGLVCLLVYVLLPAAGLCRWLVRRAGRAVVAPPLVRGVPGKAGLLHILILLLLFRAQPGAREVISSSRRQALPVVPGYIFSRYNEEVMKMENKQALIYLKPLKGAVYTDHNPLLCWNGSGYAFEQLQAANWSGIALFTGVLYKDGERLYTAWWYENGRLSTVSQWIWRWQTLKGAPPFTLINVTAADPAVLKAEVAGIAMVKGRLVGF